MSRKGKVPVTIPKGVEVKTSESVITVKGPKGTLTQELSSEVKVVVEDGYVIVSPSTEEGKNSAFHGLYRSLIDNMVIGVTKGYEKQLKMIGVGYRAALQGNLLDVQVGLSHDKKVPLPEGVAVKIEKNTLITISGSNKQVVGQFAADIRAIRPPEPYQGKGIRYVDEKVRRKAGKTAAR